jgi:hypothetical protein
MTRKNREMTRLKRHPPEVRAEAGRLIRTTTHSIAEIAEEVGAPASTIRVWMRRDSWIRPALAAYRLARSPERLAAARRLFEEQGTTVDLAILLGCSERWLYERIEVEGWRKPSREESDAAIAEIAAALRKPELSREDVIRLFRRGAALIGADALSGRGARAERNLATLLRAKGLLIDASATRGAQGERERDDAAEPDSFAEIDLLVEEIAQRFEALCGGEDAPAAAEEPHPPAP